MSSSWERYRRSCEAGRLLEELSVMLDPMRVYEHIRKLLALGSPAVSKSDGVIMVRFKDGGCSSWPIYEPGKIEYTVSLGGDVE
jgi:hypothetical protein